MANELQVAKIQIGNKIEVTQHDIVAIGIAKVEKNLKNKLSDLRSKIKKQQEVITSMSKDLDKIITNRLKSRMETYLSNVNTGFSGMSINLKCTVLYSFNRDNKLGLVEVRVGAPRAYHVQDNLEFPFIQNEIELNNAINESFKSKSELEQQALEVKKKLTDIPSLERMIRAQMAERILSESEEGKLLLESITLDDENVKLIGY